ncbi:MAG: hypothetical protein UY52_C0023G0006 [Parcubacteria group bacterium GW2011_GWC2_49_9]|nr:MAG: hypothetical protein UY52_C0023G0006 [Parcubacteria group bacterium GW2011_GWC2_49_9]
MIKRIFLFATLLFGSAIVAHSASALTLAPSMQEVTLTPGDQTVVNVELANETDKTIELTTEVVNFTSSGETGEPAFNFDADPTDLATWAVPERGPFVLAPDQTQDVLVTIDTPADALPGGYYAAVLFNETLGQESAGDVMIESKLGSLILATVEGNYTSGGTITEFSSTTPQAGGSTEFTVRFQNSGDIHLKPTGTLVIKNMFGTEMANATVNAENGAVLPDSVRSFDVSPWLTSTSLFGKYTATLTMSDGTVSDTAILSYWFFSTMWIAIIAGAAVLIILIIVLLVKKGSHPTTTPAS